jgi:hypothetical protein
MENKKIEHDYKCEKCGKVATHNLQDGGWVSWEILPDGGFQHIDTWSQGDTENHFYCEECYYEEE